MEQPLRNCKDFNKLSFHNWLFNQFRIKHKWVGWLVVLSIILTQIIWQKHNNSNLINKRVIILENKHWNQIWQRIKYKRKDRFKARRKENCLFLLQSTGNMGLLDKNEEEFHDFDPNILYDIRHRTLIQLPKWRCIVENINWLLISILLPNIMFAKLNSIWINDLESSWERIDRA